MNKTLLTAAFIAIAATAGARVLSPEEALRRIDPSDSPLAMTRGAAPKLVRTTASPSGTPAVYAFAPEKGHGYMFVSADDSAQPLLGYSVNGSLSGELPPQLEWWLSEYARQIDYNNSTLPGAVRMPRVREGREPIEPMIKTTWDQGEPYYNQCPMSGTQRTWTGCVATSMAQVMNYWRYPEKGQGSISYDAETLQKRLSLNFSLRKFDWDNMALSYDNGTYSTAQADAVAYLMKACGYAVKMDYGLDASGALGMLIGNAMVKYFNYDGNIDYRIRQCCSPMQWEELIYNNLKNVGPVLYGGGSMIGGGHSFICDGYDGNGYFHFNWGWSSMSDGYFSLDALNPYALGTGGGTGGGYNFSQDAVLGIQPPTGKPVVEKPLTLVQTGALAGNFANDTVKLTLFGQSDPMWVNYTPETLKLKFGAIIEKIDDSSFEKRCIDLNAPKFSIQPGYGASPYYFSPSFCLSEQNLSDGTYKLTFATCRLERETEEYVPVESDYGYANYIKLIKMGPFCIVKTEGIERLDIVEAEVVGDLFSGLPATIKVTLKNNSDIGLSSGYAPLFVYDGEAVILGESVLVSVEPGETVTKEWTSPLYTMSQYFSVGDGKDLYFTLFDESTYNIFDDKVWKPVRLNPNPGAPDIITKQPPVITNAEIQTEEINGHTYNIHKVTDPKNIVVDCDIQLRSGLFAYPVYACIVSIAEGDQLYVETYNGYDVTLMNPFEEHHFSTRVAFPDAQRNQVYFLLMGYAYNGGLMQIGPDVGYFRVVDESGVDAPGVETENASGAIYNLQGMPVSSDWDNLPAGIYIRGGKKEIKK